MMSMNALDSEFEDFATETTAVTAVDDTAGFRPRLRVRRPEDAEAERITLRRGIGEGSGEAQFSGSTAWALADLMLKAWAACDGDNRVEFVVRFGDGVTFTGSLDLRRKGARVASACRRVSAFRESFCPDLSDKEATPMFRFFLTNYVIPEPRSERRAGGALAA